MWDNGGFDIYSYSIRPDYEDLILARQEVQEVQEDCSGDCCHCWYANICAMCEDGGVDSE